MPGIFSKPCLVNIVVNFYEAPATLLLPPGCQGPKIDIISQMFGEYIRPYLRKFCSKVNVDQLCQIVEKNEDVYPIWLEEFSDDEKPPGFAYLFEDVIREEVKKILAELSPEHFRVFDANPNWAERQLDGLLEELFNQ